ncbi:hypothetical protein PO124_00450 [Bacillus licheniformis]|nr:hypothetical protein [Bacillus licheniformis]
MAWLEQWGSLRYASNAAFSLSFIPIGWIQKSERYRDLLFGKRSIC